MSAFYFFHDHKCCCWWWDVWELPEWDSTSLSSCFLCLDPQKHKADWTRTEVESRCLKCSNKSGQSSWVLAVKIKQWENAKNCTNLKIIAPILEWDWEWGWAEKYSCARSKVKDFLSLQTNSIFKSTQQRSSGSSGLTGTTLLPHVPLKSKHHYTAATGGGGIKNKPSKQDRWHGKWGGGGQSQSASTSHLVMLKYLQLRWQHKHQAFPRKEDEMGAWYEKGWHFSNLG